MSFDDILGIPIVLDEDLDCRPKYPEDTEESEEANVWTNPDVWETEISGVWKTDDVWETSSSWNKV